MKLLLPLLIVSLLPQGRPRDRRAPELEVVEIAARRTTERTVEIDGRVRNCGDKPLQKLVLLFHVLAPGEEVITTQRGPIEEPVLEPGQEAAFHWQMRDPARGVSVRVDATDRRSAALAVAKPGPYPIE